MIKVAIEGAMNALDGDGPRAINARKAFDGLETLDGAGWVNLPMDYTKTSQSIKDASAKISDSSDALVVIGVGGSYLGARAAIEFIKSPNYNALPKSSPDIYFAGLNLSGEYLEQVATLIGERDFSVNVVSKSGSTLETAIALRFFKELLLKRYGPDGTKDRIYVTTDGGSPFDAMAAHDGYCRFEIPHGVGGRYSVLTAVGLLPCAVAGIDIDDMMRGALEEMETGIDDACLYASARQALYRQGKNVEILSCFEPAFCSMGQWWKQLFGESEGKAGRGIFPAYADYTSDLHSLGQYIQQGERMLMETFVTFNQPRSALTIPCGPEHDDNLGELSGMSLDAVNRAASEAVKKAHIDGGVPVIELYVPDMSAKSFGTLAYFFQRACAVSALLSGVNPFGQPGVEAYKKNLLATLEQIKVE